MKCIPGPHTHPAELLFFEQPLTLLTARYQDEHNRVHGVARAGSLNQLYGTWSGRLLNTREVRDTADRGGKFSGLVAEIYEIDGLNPTDHRYLTVNQGPAAGSRRYHAYSNISAAQAHLAKWAAKRFRIPCPLAA